MDRDHRGERRVPLGLRNQPWIRWPAGSSNYRFPGPAAGAAAMRTTHRRRGTPCRGRRAALVTNSLPGPRVGPRVADRASAIDDRREGAGREVDAQEVSASPWCSSRALPPGTSPPAAKAGCDLDLVEHAGPWGPLSRDGRSLRPRDGARGDRHPAPATSPRPRPPSPRQTTSPTTARSVRPAHGRPGFDGGGLGVPQREQPCVRVTVPQALVASPVPRRPAERAGRTAGIRRRAAPPRGTSRRRRSPLQRSRRHRESRHPHVGEAGEQGPGSPPSKGVTIHRPRRRPAGRATTRSLSRRA